ncbi:MAG: MBL fold metallo-hydrolase [Thermoplasmatota archaeon]
MTKLVFLGTGGGRFVTLSQERSTGGIYLVDGVKVHIDPGPGALHALKRNGIDPTKTDGIVISHCHPDHYANGEILIEGLSFSRKGRRGVLVGPKSVIKGTGRIGPAISLYHRKKLRRVVTVSPGNGFKIGDLKGMPTPTVHSDHLCVGFRFHTKGGIVSYVSDTELREDIIESHAGSRVLILANTRPLKARIQNHLSTEDSAVFAEKIKPELCILTHMGKKMLRENPEEQALWIEKRSGVRTVAAVDDMVVELNGGIEVIIPPAPS